MEIPSHYIALIREVYPNLDVQRLEFNRDGMNNDVIVVNGRLVCRFPKSDSARRNLRHEAAVLKLLDGKTGIRLPRFEQINDDFVSYEFIEGEPLSRNIVLKLDERARWKVLAQLGEFCVALHGITLTHATNMDVGESAAQRTLEDLMRMYARVEEVLFPKLWKHQRIWVREHFAPLRDDKLLLNTTRSLIHGDLGCYHILFNEREQRLQGVLDFGTAGIGSQAVDVATLLDTYGEHIVKQALQGLGYAQDVIDEARFRSGLLWLEWALIGVENKDYEILLAHIGHSARDVLPIGSEW